jgi:hypothetical protein
MVLQHSITRITRITRSCGGSRKSLISIGSVKRYTSEGRGKLRDLLAEFRRPQEGNGR